MVFQEKLVRVRLSYIFSNHVHGMRPSRLFSYYFVIILFKLPFLHHNNMNGNNRLLGRRKTKYSHSKVFFGKLSLIR